MLVQFDKIDILEYADNYFDFKEKLEKLFGREIDLLENLKLAIDEQNLGGKRG